MFQSIPNVFCRDKVRDLFRNNLNLEKQSPESVQQNKKEIVFTVLLFGI